MASLKTQAGTLTPHRGLSDLYERDFYSWTEEQSRALRESRWDDLDWENLAEEIETVGRNDRRALVSHLEVLLAHLLKCLVQPERRTRSWDRTISAQHDDMAELIERNPSLARTPADRFAEACARAIRLAARDTGLDEERFPATPPFTLADALSTRVFPGRAQMKSYEADRFDWSEEQDLYPAARRAASIESGPFEDSFPAGLPFRPTEVLDEDFLPDPYGDELVRGPGWWRHR